MERAFIDNNLKLLQLLQNNIPLAGKVFIFKEAIQVNPIPSDSGDFQQPTFPRVLKYSNFSLVSHSQDLCLSDYVFHYSDIRFAFFLLLLMLLTLKCNACKSPKYLCVLSFVTVAVNLSIVKWVHNIFTSLSGYVQLNPGLLCTTFSRVLKYSNFSLVSHSQDLCLSDYVFHYSDIRFAFFLLLLMLLTLKCNACKSPKYLCVLSFVTVAVNLSIVKWVHNIFTSLSGYVQLNPGPKNKSNIRFI